MSETEGALNNASQGVPLGLATFETGEKLDFEVGLLIPVRDKEAIQSEWRSLGESSNYWFEFGVGCTISSSRDGSHQFLHSFWVALDFPDKQDSRERRVQRC